MKRHSGKDKSFCYKYLIIEWLSKSRINNYIMPHRVQYILSYFNYTTCFTRNICNYRFKKKSVFYFPKFSNKMLFAFLQKILSILPWGGILQHFYVLYLYNKNTLEYAKIARSGPKSMSRVMLLKVSFLSNLRKKKFITKKIRVLSKIFEHCIIKYWLKWKGLPREWKIERFLTVIQKHVGCLLSNFKCMQIFKNFF